MRSIPTRSSSRPSGEWVTFLGKLSRKRKTLGFRLAAGYALVFIVSSLAVFALAYFLLSASLQRQDRQIIESELQLYVSRYETGGLDIVIEEINARHRETLFVRVAGPANQTLLLHVPEEWKEFDFTQLEATRPGGDLQWTYLTAEEEELLEEPDRMEILSSALPDGSLVQVGKSTEARKDALEYFQNIFALFFVVVLALGVAGGAWLARRSLHPLRDLAGVLRSIRETGKLDARAPVPPTADELEELARLFNALLETIESLVTRMRGALDDIAHDLRTPLTRLRGAAEVALRVEASPETYREALADCLEESEQVLTMLNTLADISEAEAGAMKLEPEEVDLAELIRSVVGVYQHVAEEKRINLHTDVPPGLRLRADPRRLRQVVANLLDNATKYTPEGGRIEIEARAEPERLLLSVSDNGIGIESEDLPRIWDRLYRGRAGQAQRGLGLGLSLVRAVIRAHKGSVEVSSRPGQGSQFVVSLPLGPTA